MVVIKMKNRMSNRLAATVCLSVFLAGTVGSTCAFAGDGQTTNDSAAHSPGLGNSDAPAGADGNASKTDNGSGTSNSGSAATQPAEPGRTDASSSADQAKPAPVSQSPEQKPSPGKVDASKVQDAKAKTPQTSSTASKTATKKRTVLYGRIEQIAGTSGAEFPIVLKSMQAKMDTRGIQLKTGVGTNAIRGAVVKAYPFDYRGVWGGTLTIWSTQTGPICWQVDPDEAKWTQVAMKPGLVGQVNFYFDTDKSGKVQLEPAQIGFQIPMKDTNYQEQMNQMLGSGAAGQQFGSAGMSDFVRQMMGNMSGSLTVPATMFLGNVATSGMMHGTSGNQFREELVSNTIRELAQGVLEQQIITSSAEQNIHNGQVNYGYGESVVRFTKQSPDQMYVQAAVVTYTRGGQFKRKIILYGTVTRGQMVNNQPSPSSGFGNFFGTQGGGGGQMPQIPPFKPGQNPFQNLFPQ
jgi:hypothetical protein